MIKLFIISARPGQQSQEEGTEPSKATLSLSRLSKWWELIGLSGLIYKRIWRETPQLLLSDICVKSV